MGKKNNVNSLTQTIKFITGILSWVVLVILVMIAAFLLYYFISIKIYATKGEEFKPPVSLYTILTPSMVPNINPDDVIVDITVKNPESIKIGDVITFVSSASLTQGMTITHRVIDIKVENGEYLYYTKGDANLSQDIAPAKFKNVLGKVLFKVPKLGLIQHFLATRGGWLIVVVIPALLIIGSDIIKIVRLKTAKDQLEQNNKIELEKEEQQQKEKQIIEQKLLEKYGIKRKENELEPILKKEYIIMQKDIKPKVTLADLPRKIDLPKLKIVEEKKEERKEEIKPTKKKKRKSRKQKDL